MESAEETAHRGKVKAKEPAKETTAAKPEAETTAAKPEAPVTEEQPEAEAHRPRHVTLHLPLTTVEIRAPHLPQAPHVDLAATARTVREAMPPPAEVAYFAGLGLLGVLEVLEWPVVLAVSAGTVIAQRVGWTAGRRPEPAATAASGD